MTQTFTARFAAFVLAAVIVTTAWVSTVTVPLTGQPAVVAASMA